MTVTLIEEIPLGDARLREFVEVPWRLYRGDPFWTPPLRAEYLGSRLLGTPGLLTPQHPYHQNAEVTHFLARRGSDPVGRISAAINHRFNDYHDAQIGFFGFFETVEDLGVAWCFTAGLGGLEHPMHQRTKDASGGQDDWMPGPLRLPTRSDHCILSSQIVQLDCTL